jgi:hypothetical protein
VAQVLLGTHWKHRWLRLLRAVRYCSPYLPEQPGYHKRLKAAEPLLGVAIDHLGRQCPGMTRCG